MRRRRPRRRCIPRMPRPEAPDIDALLQQPGLSAAMSASLRELARRGELRRYRKDTLLLEEGDHGDTLYIILAGRLRAFAAAANGREVTYGVYGLGEFLGEMSLDGGPRSASVITLEPTTCAVVTRNTLLSAISEHPEFALELLAKVIRRARAATLSIKQMALNDVYGRLKFLLESMAVAGAGGERVIEEPLTQREIADRLGCSREMVSRLIKDLRQGGYVVVSDRHIRLTGGLPVRW